MTFHLDIQNLTGDDPQVQDLKGKHGACHREDLMGLSFEENLMVVQEGNDFATTPLGKWTGADEK